MRDRLIRVADLGNIPTPERLDSSSIVPADSRDSKNGLYVNLLSRIRSVVSRTIHGKSPVIVVSKGDNELLKFDGLQGWHFPQTSDGTYAGYHPADSIEAIRHLESLENKGAEFLLFPQTAFWWLDHYIDFRNHLEDRYPRIWNDPDCIIFKLSRKPSLTLSTAQKTVDPTKQRRRRGHRTTSNELG